MSVKRIAGSGRDTDILQATRDGTDFSKKTTIITQVRKYRAKSEPLAGRGSNGSHDSPIRTAALTPSTPVTYAIVATCGEVGIGGGIRAGARRCNSASTAAWPRQQVP